jgi:tRNA (mo5U34)-methyltransferase
MSAVVEPDDLRRRAAHIRWYHTMDLGNGVTTRGATDPSIFMPRLCLPDLTGKQVLDVGAWDGYFSFEAERRGAARVVATDSYSWGGPGWGSKAGFQVAREALGSKVEDVQLDVMELDPRRIGRFDVVLFLGGLYHMRDPVGALERVASVTKEQLIIETEVGMLLNRRPAAAFYPGAELAGDPSNWWAPNPKAVIGMLQAVGFCHAQVVWKRGLPRRVVGWVRNKARGRSDMSLIEAMQRFRFVFHAWR